MPDDIHAPDTLALLQDLISRRSLTPEDAGCCALIGARLAALGFHLEWLPKNGVTNLWAVRGESAPCVVLAGHTDVVPTGPLTQWSSDPFEPSLRDGILYGRGAADMKSGLACMVTAVERLLSRTELQGSIAFLITSDEEGPCRDGTRHVVEVLRERGVAPEYAIVGEASSMEVLGDRIMVGRRGSLGCNLRVHGKQGHVAYPQRADNPIHRLVPALNELIAMRWDHGNAHFPPTSFQVSNLGAGTGAHNVIPGEAEAVFNLRYSTELDADRIKARVHTVLDRYLERYDADWWHTGEPFLTPGGPLVEAAHAAVHAETGLQAEHSTGGGTSDGRFIATLGTQVVEIGPVNRSIHQIDEHVRVDDLECLSRIYEHTLERLLTA